MTAKEEKGLKFLKNLSQQLHKHTYSEAKIWLQDYIPRLPSAIRTAELLWRFEEDGWYRDPYYLYRARENETKLDTASLKYPFQSVQDISHVPFEKAHLIKEYGRCNLPGQPMFYCSNYYPTACIESLTNGFVKDISDSKSVTMSSWRINEPLILAEVMFSKNKLLQLKQYNEEGYEKKIQFTEKWYDNILALLANDTDQSFTLDYAKELFEFFSDEFGKIEISNGNDYILSNFYCDNIFNQTFLADGITPIDGIIYPSVKYSFQEHNIVLHPRAMKKLSFSSASQVWVVYHVPSKDVEFIPLETGFKDDASNIKWNRWKI